MQIGREICIDVLRDEARSRVKATKVAPRARAHADLLAQLDLGALESILIR